MIDVWIKGCCVWNMPTHRHAGIFSCCPPAHPRRHRMPRLKARHAKEKVAYLWERMYFKGRRDTFRSACEKYQHFHAWLLKRFMRNCVRSPVERKAYKVFFLFKEKWTEPTVTGASIPHIWRGAVLWARAKRIQAEKKQQHMNSKQKKKLFKSWFFTCAIS